MEIFISKKISFKMADLKKIKILCVQGVDEYWFLALNGLLKKLLSFFKILKQYGYPKIKLFVCVRLLMYKSYNREMLNRQG